MNRFELKKALRNREKLFGAWISYDHPSIADTFALSGFDFISIDMEHAPISLSKASQIISISQGHNVPCLPRPVSHSNDIFKPLLDAGADGLTVQMVETIQQVNKLSEYLKYPPLGKRTFGVNRAQGYGLNFDEYIKKWNESSSLIVQIESKIGVENIDDIASHDCVDGVMIGPYDLSGSYGLPGQINHPQLKKASQKVIESCKKFNKSCGTQISNPDKQNINEAFREGYTYVILSSDLFVLSNWSKSMKKLISEFK